MLSHCQGEKKKHRTGKALLPKAGQLRSGQEGWERTGCSVNWPRNSYEGRAGQSDLDTDRIRFVFGSPTLRSIKTYLSCDPFHQGNADPSTPTGDSVCTTCSFLGSPNLTLDFTGRGKASSCHTPWFCPPEWSGRQSLRIHNPGASTP